MNQEDLLNFNENPKKKDLKKPLIIGGVAFLVFVGGVVGYALFSGKQENVVLPPKVVEPKKEHIFKEVPIQEKPLQPKEVKIEEPAVKEEKVQEQKIKIEDIVEKPAPKPVMKEVVKEEKTTPKRKEAIQEVKQKAPIKKEVTIKPKYYIQVLALLRHKAPDKNFLKLIKKEGFSYTFYKTYLVKNGEKIPVTKVLVGPFKDYQTAKRMLRVVREKITKHSFIFKVK